MGSRQKRTLSYEIDEWLVRRNMPSPPGSERSRAASLQAGLDSAYVGGDVSVKLVSLCVTEAA